jgi:hypothetical protein
MNTYWETRDGRNREGDKFSTDYLVDSSTGRVLADISCPLNDEFTFVGHLMVGVKEAFFRSREDARRYCEKESSRSLALEQARDRVTDSYTHSWRYRMLYRLFRVESSHHQRLNQ